MGVDENAPDNTLQQFITLSEILTGCDNLDVAQGRAHLDRLLSTPLVPSISEVLKRFEKLPKGSAEVQRKMVVDATLRPTLCQIVLLWYTSALRDTESDPVTLRYGSEQEYFAGLVWRILGAHPPGLSGGYFGHWRYRPDNEPKSAPK
jgi:hypothetical protein